MTTGTMIGAIVRSDTGRDAGRLYVIVGIADDGLLLLSDGKRRRIGRPKKKRYRHITLLRDAESGSAAVTALQSRECSDRMLRVMLAEYRRSAETENGQNTVPIQERRDFSAEG